MSDFAEKYTCLAKLAAKALKELETMRVWGGNDLALAASLAALRLAVGDALAELDALPGDK